MVRQMDKHIGTPPEKKLSSGLLDDIRANWLADTLPASADSTRCIRACLLAATSLAIEMKRQLAGHEMTCSEHENTCRAILLGYTNGMSEAMLSENGDCSLWAIELISLSALLDVLGDDWDEDELCGLGQRLRQRKNAGYLAGLRAADWDHATRKEGGNARGLATCIVDLEMNCMAGFDGRRGDFP
jgi:hypothetical protein